MTKFFACDGGRWINLDCVAEIEEGEGKNGFTCLEFSDANGRRVGCKSLKSLRDLRMLLGDVLPAAAGAVATVITVPTEGERPTEVLAEWVPIAAWCVIDGQAEPILVQEPIDEEAVVLIEGPDGVLRDGVASVYPNLDAAKAAILADAQEDWDYQAARKKGKVTEPLEAEPSRGLPN
jgi:hypothetical protein